MKKNKLFYVLSAVLILAGVAFFNSVSANDDRSGEDHGNSEQAKEAHNNGSTLEVHIGDTGKVLVRGAKVTAVSGSTVSAFTAWGSVNLNWSINVLSDGKMVRRFGGNGSVSEISVGDFVSFQGTLVDNSSSPIVVNASIIKDWSIQKPIAVKTTVEGKIGSLTNGVLVVRVGDKDFTINVASNTSILNSSWLQASVSSFNVGDKIRVYGLVNSTNMTIDATVARDTSL